MVGIEGIVWDSFPWTTQRKSLKLVIWSHYLKRYESSWDDVWMNCSWLVGGESKLWPEVAMMRKEVKSARRVSLRDSSLRFNSLQIINGRCVRVKQASDKSDW